MPKLTSRVGRTAKRAAAEAEMHIMAAEGRKSVKAKVARVKRVVKKAFKAAVIAGAIAATTTVMRERRKRQKLES